MKCCNCGRRFNEKNVKTACTMIDCRTGDRVDVKRIIESEIDKAVALCPFCVRMVAYGVSAGQQYTVKDFDKEYFDYK